MTNPARSPQRPPSLQDALAWLHQEPAAEPLRDLAPLLRNLREAADTSRPPTQRQRVLELFRMRTMALTRVLKPDLMDATLPLAPRLRTIAQGLADIHGTLAALILRVALDLTPATPGGLEGNLPLLTGVLENLAEQQQAALLVAGPSPVNLWAQVQTSFQLLDSVPAGSRGEAENTLKSILALAAAQPETYTARELAFLVNYLALHASAVEVARAPTERPEDWYWLEDGRDLPPVAVARRPAPPDRTIFFFRCTALGTQALADAGTQPNVSAPTANRPAEEFRATLVHAAERWLSPPKRRGHRRPVHFRVEICTSLENLWLLSGGGPEDGSTAIPATTQWMVMNESPSGFGLMHVSGTLSPMAAGDPIGMRRSVDEPWNVCLIRWARSDNPEHLELGVEFVAPAAAPITIACRPPGADSAVLAHSLLLPPLPALHRNETILAQRSRYGSTPLTMIREIGGRLQLTECRPERLVLQTAQVDIFEFSRDFAAA